MHALVHESSRVGAICFCQGCGNESFFRQAQAVCGSCYGIRHCYLTIGQ
ncbi:hypothetical protein PAMC26577_34355 [Caballeronia sordidicola]|uniref:Uncharacterized protein n=1 Tax=Caballeronia sordidicola TaxID=196367 RepID=A0A242MB85_CABSO|nr:hypothetical protein PAMC26577_34355 [Caballeronia sordidicola]